MGLFICSGDKVQTFCETLSEVRLELSGWSVAPSVYNSDEGRVRGRGIIRGQTPQVIGLQPAN